MIIKNMGTDQPRPDFDQIQHQSIRFKELENLIRTGSIPNALLFSGPPDTGRKKAAVWFAKGCNCTCQNRIACGECKPCLKIDNHLHPDILFVDLLPGKKNISISQVREVGLALCSKPNEARYRMVLLQNAHFMNPQAQNALLKMLEEPPEKTFFILICDKTARMLPTILSRCRHIRFSPPTDNQVKDWLIRHCKTEHDMAHIIAKTMGSNLKKIQTCIAPEDGSPPGEWFIKRKFLLTGLTDIIMSDPPQNIRAALMISQGLCRTPDLIEDTLSVIRTFLRDLTIFECYPEKIVNLDFYDTFADINKILTRKKCSDRLNVLFESEQKLASHCTPRLTLDSFFLQIASLREG